MITNGKRMDALAIITLFLICAFCFFLGYLTHKDFHTNSLSAVIEIIDKNYLRDLTPQEIQELYYIAIEAVITKKLDSYTKFFRPPSRASVPTKRPTSVSYEIMNKSVSYQVIEKNIGYIKISNFDYLNVPIKVSEALEYCEYNNVIGLILDLRDNFGGYINTAIKTTKLFLGKDQIIATVVGRSKGRIFKKIYIAKKQSRFTKPMVILINDNSASATELFAGALHDNKRATLIGITTLGKGVGQYEFIFRDGSVLYLTGICYFLPNKLCPQDIGIIPDIMIEDPVLQLQKAIEILKNSSQ